MGFVRTPLLLTFLLLFASGHADEATKQSIESEQSWNVNVIRSIDEDSEALQLLVLTEGYETGIGKPMQTSISTCLFALHSK